MHRLTVTSFVNSQDPAPLTLQQQIQYIQFDQQFGYIYARSQTGKGQLKMMPLLRQKQISDQEKLYEKIIAIELKCMKSIIKHKHFLVIVDEECCDLLVYDLNDDKLDKLAGHILPITAICSYSGYVVTGSRDMTVRFWEICKKNGELKVKGPVAKTEHSHRIIFLKTYGNFLISGSHDKTLKFWCDKVVWTTYKFQYSPIDVCQCPISQQIIVASENRLLHFISVPRIAQTRKIQITKSLEIDGDWVSGSQIDESFMIYADSVGNINFVEVNLIKQVHRKKIEAGVLLGKRRIIFMGNKKGILMIKM